MRKREALFLAAMATLGGDGCRDSRDKEPIEKARVSVVGPKERPEEKGQDGRPRKFIDVLGRDLQWRKKGRGITENFDFEGETVKLLAEAKERMWKVRFGLSQRGFDNYFDKIIENQEYRAEVWQALNKYCRYYRVPPEVAAGVIGVESGGDNDAVSAVGARGIFQVTGVVLEELQRVSFSKEKDWGGVKLNSVDGNCRAGVAFLRYLFERYSQWNFALAAYRGGPSAIDASIRKSSKYKRAEEDKAGSFRKFVFGNAINATVVSSTNGLGLANEAVWQYPFNAAVMARPVYEILTSREKKPEIDFQSKK
ncbi:MAG: transglycosylase SLT domain-containing protein [Candidatus Magasanikbacteria bacterium]|nr:transglycosylase SLT domain-containing protein [Candidatus Magasanikbacteria bacterium]